tara:strand:+ start:254 stop:1357 length:1104 start_codon:yes stop_codon:yes gene_type:complete
MGIYTGIRHGLAAVEEKKLNQKKLQLSQDQEDRLNEQLELTTMKTKFDLLDGLRKTLGGGSGSSTTRSFKKSAGFNANESFENNVLALTKTYNISEDAIKKVSSEGGPVAISKLLEISKGLQEKISSGEYVTGDFNTLIGGLISNRITTPAKSEPLDLSSLEGIVSKEMMTELQLMDPQNNVAGMTTFNVDDVSLVKKMSLADVNKVEENFSRDLITQASVELNRLNKITQEVGEPNSQIPEEVSQWATARTAVVANAKKDATVKNPDMGGLLSLYGSGYYDMIAENRPGFVPSKEILPSILEKINESPVLEIRSDDNTNGSSAELYMKLLDDYNLIEEGQMINVWDEESQTYLFGPAGGNLVKVRN